MEAPGSDADEAAAIMSGLRSSLPLSEVADEPVVAYGPDLPPVAHRTFAVRVYDQTTPGNPPKRLDPDTLTGARLADLVTFVSEKLELSPELFELRLIFPRNIQLGHLPDSTLLEDVGFKEGVVHIVQAERPPNLAQYNTSSLHKMYERNSPPKASVQDHVLSIAGRPGLSGSADARASMHRLHPQFNIQPFPSFSTVKSATGYVGLANQGATCYLNSLIQTLFMTPEFRRGLYQWNFNEWVRAKFEQKLSALLAKSNDGNGSVEHSETMREEDIEERFAIYRAKMAKASIARQLQRLFVGLQTSDERALKTRSLTESFGWVGSEAFEQHDVQELMRILLEALEDVKGGGVVEVNNGSKELKEADKDMQYGEKKDTMEVEVTEKNITAESNGVGPVPLPQLFQGEIKDYVQCPLCGFESSRTTPFLDVQLVIRAFGTPEPVKSVEEALQKYTEVETLDLANAWQCEKCQKPVEGRKGLSFTKLPYLLCLQLKRFDFDPITMSKIKLNDRVTFPEVLEMSHFLSPTTSSPHPVPVVPLEEKEDGMEIEDSPNDPPSLTGSIEGTKLDNVGLDRMELEAGTDAASMGDQTYDLYAVLVHRGSHIGGHYYAYIKSFASNNWLLFDDSAVTEVSFNRVEEAFGSKSGFAGAYMLVYRQRSKLLNQVEPMREDVPDVLLLKNEEVGEEVPVLVRYNDSAVEIKVRSTATLGLVAAQAMKELGKFFSEGNLRLRAFDKQPGRVYQLDQLVETLLPRTHFPSASIKQLVIETKQSGEEFLPIDEKGTFTVHVLQADGDWKDFRLSRSDLSPPPTSAFRSPLVVSLKRALVNQGAFPAGTDASNIVIVNAKAIGNKVPSDNEVISFHDAVEFFAELRVAKEYQLPVIAAGMELDDVEKGYFDEESESADGVIAFTPKGLHELERRRAQMEILVSAPGNMYRIIKASTNWPLGRLRAIISEIFGIPYEECKLLRVASDNEVTGEQKRISAIYPAIEYLKVKKERFAQEDEIELNVHLFEPNPAPGKPLVRLMCSITVNKKVTVSELQHLLVKEHPELAPAESLRFRKYSMFSAPREVYKLTEEVSTLFNFGYKRDVVVSKMSHNGANKAKVSSMSNCVFLQRFDPHSYALGERIEVTVDDDLPLSEFRNLVRARSSSRNSKLTMQMRALTGIAHPAVAKASGFVLDNVSGIPGLHVWKAFPEDLSVRLSHGDENWVQVMPLNEPFSLTVRSLSLMDGQLLLCMDIATPLAQLSEEELKTLDTKQKRFAASAFSIQGERREGGLRITQRDYDI